MKSKQLLALAGVTLALLFAAVSVSAQGGGGRGGFGAGGGAAGGGGAFGPGGGPGGGGFGPGGGGPGGGGFGPGGGGPGGGGYGRANFDPAQIQQYLLDALKQEFEVTNDDEWKVIGDQVMKVYDAQTQGAVAGVNITRLLRGVLGGGGFGGGNGPGGGGRGNRNGGGLTALLGGSTAPDVEGDALQLAIDNKAAPAELKAAIARVMDARKKKQERLQKAQADLRQLLSVRQEAIACSLGLL